MRLTDKRIQNEKPGLKQRKISDGGGLTLVIQPNGTKLWQFRFQFNKKPQTLSLGVYPVVSLKQARERAFEARRLVAQGINPHELKKEEARAAAVAKAAAGLTVERVAREWFNKFSEQWVEAHSSKIIRRFERDLFPYLGGREIGSVAPAELLNVVRRVEARGIIETAHRLLQSCGQVWRYAVACGYVDRDITGDLRGALAPRKRGHLGAITEPSEIGRLLQNIDEYRGSPVVRLALRLAPYVFVRPGELRRAKWSEFDFDKALWVIPAERMKARRPHVVPLAVQVIEILKELRLVSGGGEYLFPSPQSATRPISDVALLAALRRMGYEKHEMTTHGFRAMASTNLEQLGFDSRLIELQLAHADLDSVRVAYKRETHLLMLPERAVMMQRWADWLDGLKRASER